MTNFLEDSTTKKQEKTSAACGYRRLFVLVLAIALLGQMISFIHMQLRTYHYSLLKDFKVVLVVTGQQSNEELTAIGERINSQEEVAEVKLFSPQDGLKMLQAKNARLAQALVSLGRESMPAYFEVRLTNSTLHAVRPFVQRLEVEYPQLSVKYSPEQADMAFYTGLCLRIFNILLAFVLVIFLTFMFMVEAYPISGGKNSFKGAWMGVLAALMALALTVVVLYPTGLLSETLQYFTSWERQAGLAVFCGLLGWTLGKWQKF